jgi:hypothetical protein
MSKNSQGDFVFSGFEQANTTPVPDVFFDELLPELSGAELKVLLYIIRRTKGFKKDTDAISLTQFENGIVTSSGKVLDKGCGLSRETICKALVSLETKGCIKSEKRTSKHGSNAVTLYSIRFKGEVVGKTDQGSRKNRPPKKVVGKTDQGSRIRRKKVVGKTDPQQTVLQQTVLQQTERERRTESQKPTRTQKQKTSSLSSQLPSQKSFSLEEVPPEANPILDSWDEIQGYEGPRTEREIKTALEMRRLKIAKEDMKAIKAFALKNNAEWYEEQGMDIQAILTYHPKWKSAQELKASKASQGQSHEEQRPPVLVTVGNEENLEKMKARRRAKELATAQAKEA